MIYGKVNGDRERSEVRQVGGDYVVTCAFHMDHDVINKQSKRNAKGIKISKVS